MSTLELSDLADIVVGDGAELLPWLERNRARVDEGLSRRGAVMLRGFRAEAEDTAEQALGRVGHELLFDAFWSTPRTSVAKKTFTATEYASNRTISLHSEMSYMTSWPRLIAFHALIVAEEGGETTICDVDRVSDELGAVLEPFAEKGVIYQRTHHQGIDVPWRKAFQTDDKAEVERIAREGGMEIRWLPKDVLQTRHAAQGCVQTEDGRLLFFNQTNLFHPANLPAGALPALTELLGADNLPRNAFYGDGSAIPDAAIRRVNEVFDRHAHGVRWRAGDVLVLDNMRFAHGRSTFKGKRKLHVAMANLHKVARRTPWAA